jgi:DNA-binding MurR/RpiR family transcriptional regulator
VSGNIETAFAEVQERLGKALPTLTRSQQRAAALLLDQPGQVATLPVRKLAEIAGIGAPNFDRLAKTLGFPTFGEMRDIYRQRIQAGDPGNYHVRAGSLLSAGRSDGIGAVWESFRSASVAGVERVYRDLPPERIEGMVDVLAARRTIHVCGFESSRAPALHLTYLGAMVSPAFRLLGRGGGPHVEDMVSIGAEDALVAIALSPCAAPTIEAAHLAVEAGAYVLGITDSHASPLARVSDEVLLTPTASPLFFESYLGTIAIIELLVGAFTLKMGDGAVDRIERIEALRHRMNNYWP